MFNRLILCFILFLFSSSVLAEQLLLIVTPRNVPEVVSGAHEFLKHPSHSSTSVQIRTTEQWQDLSVNQQAALLKQSDLVFAGGVFGETANQLVEHSKNGLLKNLIALHSDQRLMGASSLNSRPILNGPPDKLMQHPDPALSTEQWMASLLVQYPAQEAWLISRFYWLGRNSENMQGLISHLHHLVNNENTTERPQLAAQLRLYYQDKIIPPDQFAFSAKSSWVVLLDYETGERPGEKALLDAVCKQLINESTGCVSVLTAWGDASLSAMELLAENKSHISSVVSLQDFVIGGSEHRQAVTDELKKLNVPVIKAMRLSDSTHAEWELSEAGISWDSVHYRVAMPELQGVSQPMVVATMTPAEVDKFTGARLAFSEPVESQVTLLVKRLKRWEQLQDKANQDKKIAIIYYNHPPGRHNIGADNLNVVESLFDILHSLKNQGYKTGELPASSAELLDLLQQRGVNLPEDQVALAAMSSQVNTMDRKSYQSWFQTLPESLQQEMVNGPLGLLHANLKQAKALNDPSIAAHLLARVMEDIRHVVDGADHAGRDRVLQLLSQLQTIYQQPLANIDWQQAEQLINAISQQWIEGIRGWGEAPGNVMVYEDKILIPGLEFGNIFVGPQPPRGWELNEELLHANLSFPPPHQYLAFYQWLRNTFHADALVHLGRHSTYEFLPRHRVGMAENDYPQAILGDLPSIYPYIVDGVGEGIQAKRRGLAVMVDHLTPPLASTELYDQLLELRQVVESYEAAPVNAGAMRDRAIEEMKRLVAKLNLEDELTANMAGELEVRGLSSFEQVDDDLLVHEIGHYLTTLQEDFMPLGLHIFGRDWSEQAVQTMLTSMNNGKQATESWDPLLRGSPAAEMSALLAALDGQFVEPGKGNDPIRTPSALPTGRNFYALDDSLIPSRLGYKVGIALAEKARAETPAKNAQDSDALVLWASDVVRDEGAMIAFAYDMLGVKPTWSRRGIFSGLERLDLSSSASPHPRIRRDMLLTTSGLFRDLYGSQIVWLEQAVLMALDASSGLIRRDYPALTLSLDAALERLQVSENPGFESLEQNQVAARWVDDASAALRAGVSENQAGLTASYRIFGTPPGAYGAGVNRLVERSGAWENREEVAQTYIHRMGHAYGAELDGQAQQALFQQRLQHVGQTYLGRASNLYGVMDNNDAFDYLGGLSLAIETTRGQAPESYILAHSDTTDLRVDPLQTVLLGELRGRYLNPQWLKPLMKEGYAGARTMGSEFLEYLWGWQVTNPGIVKSWVWDEVKRVYVDDGLDLGLDDFLEQDHNVHVKSNMLAIMLVAAYKGFWQADEATLEQLAQQFTDLVSANGLPGSGHTSPSHPMYVWLNDYLDESHQQQLAEVLNAARMPETEMTDAPSHIAEITEQKATQPEQETNSSEEQQQEQAQQQRFWLYVILGLVALLVLAGMAKGMRAPTAKFKE